MSVSKSQLQDFSKYVMNHDAVDVFRERVQMTCFNMFRNATAEKREIINAIMDNESMFFAEIQKVLNEMSGDEPVNDDEDTQDERNER